MSDPIRPLVALAGNPNTGKTTLFNALTTSRDRVGNYPGVTVERRVSSAVLDKAGKVDVVDVPGTYSLVARTGDEQIAVESLIGLRDERRPDAVVFCVSATQALRGLYLVLQAQELGVPALVALTMVDELGKARLDADALSKAMDCPVVPISVPKGIGLDELRTSIDQVIEARDAAPKWKWTPSPELAMEVARIVGVLPEDWPQVDAVGLWALMSIDRDDELLDIPAPVRSAVLATERAGEAIDEEAVRARYRWLDATVGPMLEVKQERRMTDRLDRLLIHRVFGFAVFLLIMFVVFQSLFAWADPAIALIETVFAAAGGAIENAMGPGIVTEFLVNGLIAGVGSVVVFLPQILMLFFFIGLMEDSGYMARVAYLMDRIMKSMGLHGRAFVPMMSGFACAVPAILATRTLERRRDRFLTMMVVPLMTCSARLPVYTLIIAALFPAGHVLGIFPIQGFLMIAMYLFSVIVALIAAWVLSRTLKSLRARRLPFVIELPPYRIPRFRDVLRMMWSRTSSFLKEAGTVILGCTIVLWALLSFPRDLSNPSRDYETLIAAAESEEVAQTLTQERQGELLRQSYGGRLGRAIEPAIEPLGFDWKIGVGLIGAFAAREVFISTLGVVYSVGDDVDEGDATLRQRMRAEKRSDGGAVYTPLVGLSLMIFFALACQCMGTLAAVKRETRGYRWPIFLFAYMTVLAWVASFIVYQGGRLLGFG